MSPLLEHFVRRQGRPLQFGLIFRAPTRAFLSMLVAHHLLCCLLPPVPFFSLQAYSVLDSLVLELFPDLTHVLGR